MDLMSRICAPKALVFDGFAGTGTTLIAAENLGRTSYCMEVDPESVAIILERASRAFPHLKIEKVDQARAA
jgi:DNA modification methylase